MIFLKKSNYIQFNNKTCHYHSIIDFQMITRKGIIDINVKNNNKINQAVILFPCNKGYTRKIIFIHKRNIITINMTHKFRYFSDLHLEFIKPSKIDEFIKRIPSGINEICILAGDIGNPYQPNYNIFMNFISKNFKKTFVITGNHEYYNKTKTIQETNDFMEDYFKQFNNISFLNNNYEKYKNYCFIGTTLWSKIINPKYEINDVHHIPNFDYIQYNRLNMLCVDFLEDTIENNDNCIIITHHVPSSSLIDIKYKTQDMKQYNQWFYCDMDKIIETKGYKIKCWFYGNTHTPSNVIINNISFLCNPIGYPNENNKINFDLNIIINN